MSDIGKNTKDLGPVAGFTVKGEAEAAENRKILKDYSSLRMSWYRDRVDNDRFYHGVHYTPAEERAIEATGQTPLSINITYPIVKQIISFLTAESPIWDVSPVGDTDKGLAYISRHLLNAMWYNSRAWRKLHQICKEMAITGIGWGTVNPRADSTFGLVFTNVPYHNVYFDPRINEVDFSDAENIIISKIVSVHQAALFLNKTKEEIIEYSKADDTLELERDIVYPRYIAAPSFDSNNVARITQRYTIEHAKVYVVTPKNKQGSLGYRIYFEKDDRLKRLEASGAIEIKEVTRKVVAKYISIGPYCEKYYLPIDSYNVVPFIYEFSGNPFVQGEIDFIYGVQRALNRFIMLTVLNAALSNNMKVIAPAGSIDEAKFLESYSMPGALIQYEWRDGMPPPTEIKPQPLSSDFLSFPRMLIQIMEYISGVFGVIQGNPQGAPRTASGLLSLQNYGSQKIKLVSRGVQDSLAALGDVALNLFRNYAGYNQSVTYYSELEKKEHRVEYNTLKIVDGGNIVIENDLSAGQYQTRVIIRTDYGSERLMKATVLSNLASQTRSPALIKPILKLADIPEADEVADQLDALANANQTIEQLQSSLKRMNQINTQMENEILRKARQVEIQKFISNLDSILNKIQKEAGVNIAREIESLKSRIQSEAMANQVPTNGSEGVL